MSTLRSKIEKEVGMVIGDGSKGGVAVKELVDLFKQQMLEILGEDENEEAITPIEKLNNDGKTYIKRRVYRNELKAQLRQEVEKL